jgi:hypothetical protein
MFNFFEQPWTLVGVAILVLFGVLTFRSIFEEKRRWWQLTLPALLAVLAFGLDFLVQTDLEKINVVIKKGIKAVENENCNDIAQIIADDYSDSHHKTKYDLILHCSKELSQPVVQKCKRTSLLVETSSTTANATLAALLRFEKDSYIYQNFKPFLFVKLQLNLQKQRDTKWLINRAEILELDRQPINWGDIR